MTFPMPFFDALGLIGGNDSFTKVLLHMDGADTSTTFTDVNVGGSSHTWTANGNAQIDTAQFKFGGASGLFDGSGDWISTPDSADFTIGSGDFTVDFWYRPAANGVRHYLTGQMASSGAVSVTSFAIQRTLSNVFSAFIGIGGSPTALTGTTTTTVGQWYHVALVRTGTTLKLFVNGTQEGGDGAASGTINDVSATLSVGRSGEFTSDPANGHIDEYRFSVGIARWTGNFTPPNAPYSTV